MTDVTSETLRQWRESKGWDVPRMARELRKAARDTGEDVAAHHGLVKMIPQWERGARAPRERYRLLYLKVFADIAGGLSPGLAVGAEVALRLAAVRARAASLPGPDQIRALEAAALAKPRRTMTPAEIRALAAESIATCRRSPASSRNCRRCWRRRGRRGQVMTAREDKIRQVVAELDVQVAEVEANIAVLKALLAEGEVPEEQEDPS